MYHPAGNLIAQAFLREGEETRQRELANSLTLDDIKAVAATSPEPFESMEVREAAAAAVGLRILSRGDLRPQSPDGKPLPKPALFDHPAWCRKYARNIKDPAALGLITRFLNLVDAVEGEQVRVGARVPFKKVLDTARTLGLAQGTAAPSSNSRPIPVSTQRQETILKMLVDLGYDPLKLPPRRQGQTRWVKAEVRDKVRQEHLCSEKTFDTAWGKLRSDGKIAEAGSV